MSGCLAQSDVQELGESFLHEFDVRVPELSPDLCASLNQEARQLEAHLTTMYKIVAMLARSEEDMERVAALWGMMVHFCDEAAQRICKLSSEHPHCSASQYFDRICDMGKKCQRLEMMHS